uniref:Uncharacterized protein n=1 Tax=Myotis myotis TaxID=51298 RepID=A0A7J7ZXV7_MYOMY|nr:hypothetical protein mMyoMyo1_009834 [Myotis myotis]
MCVAAAPQTSVDYIGLLLLRRGQSTHVAAAPQMGSGCSRRCCSLYVGGLLRQLLLLRWGQVARTAAAPQTGTGCGLLAACSCCSLDRAGLHWAAAPLLWAGCSCSCCSLTGWTAHVVSAPWIGGAGCSHSCFSLDRGRPRNASILRPEASYPLGCCSLDRAGCCSLDRSRLLMCLLLTWLQCPGLKHWAGQRGARFRTHRNLCPVWLETC